MDHVLTCFGAVFELWTNVATALIEVPTEHREELMQNDTSGVMRTMMTNSFWRRMTGYSTEYSSAALEKFMRLLPWPAQR